MIFRLRASALAWTVVTGLAGAGCAPPETRRTDADALGDRVDLLFEGFQDRGSPGVTVAVAHEGQVVHAGAYGLADLASGRRLTPSTPVRLGSLSKQFTAMAIMLLAERGALSYDDPVTTWVPEIGRFGKITVRHLLTHTSGLPDYYEQLGLVREALAGADGDPLLTAADAVTIWADWGDPVFPIGEKFEYSNPGYEALAVIAERASGQSFADFLEDHVFEPLGMTNTFVRHAPNLPARDRAIGYRPAGDDGWEENDDHPFNWMLGAGGVYASVEDLMLWDRALFTDALVSSNTLAQAFTPMTLNDGTTSAYGFGWGLGDRLGRRAVGHTGGWVGFRTAIIRFLEDRLTVVVLSNASAAANDLAEAVARIYLPIDPPGSPAP